jgi:catechol 2,3-dioxygenase-like lactoylglutathione lyase family enzyme
MFNGAHVVIYTKDPEADRAFFRDVLKFSYVDGGHGWLIFAMPQLEAAFHDSEKNDQHELFLMCENLDATLKELKSKKVKISDTSEQRWGGCPLRSSRRRKDRHLRTETSESCSAALSV